MEIKDGEVRRTDFQRVRDLLRTPWVAGVVSLIVILGAAGIMTWSRYRSSPDYVLARIRDAIRDHNRLEFQRFVDIEQFAESAADDFVSAAVLQQLDGETGGWGALGTMLGAGLVEQLKPALATRLRSGILNAVESGQYDEFLEGPTDEAGGDREINLAEFASRTAALPQTFAGLSEVQRSGDLAIVGLRFESATLDTVLTLNLRMEKGNSAWRVVALDNLSGYLERVTARQASILAAENELVAERLSGFVELGPLRQSMRQIRFSDYLALSVRVTNITGDSIAQAVVILGGLPDAENRDRFLLVQDPLPPGESGDALAFIRYNQFIDWHVTGRYADWLEPELFHAVLRRGSTVDRVVKYLGWDDYLARGPYSTVATQLSVSQLAPTSTLGSSAIDSILGEPPKQRAAEPDLSRARRPSWTAATEPGFFRIADTDERYLVMGCRNGVPHAMLQSETYHPVGWRSGSQLILEDGRVRHVSWSSWEDPIFSPEDAAWLASAAATVREISILTDVEMTTFRTSGVLKLECSDAS